MFVFTGSIVETFRHPSLLYYMHTRVRYLGAAALLLSQLLPSVSAYAKTFPDVPLTHIYVQQIGELSDRGIIKGNPDGYFQPNKTVNRAELLTMLYRAKGKNPAAPTKACFKDVNADAWFSAVVCDASKNAYVAGYSDGNFRPEKVVNRVEALKMIHTVFGFQLNSNASMTPVKAFTDVSLDAWYTAYMANAFEKKILPISGQDGTKFKPDAELFRGEAAAYIFNALGLTLKSSSSSSVQTRSARSSSSAMTVSETQVVNVDFPFEDDGSFSAKKGKAYIFSVKQPVVASIDVAVEGDDATVQCRIYKLEGESSFAYEYYIGHVIGNHCSMRVSLSNGNYQMEVTPKGVVSSFKLTSRKVTGDGNDGFREAAMLTLEKPKSGYLETEDHAEWFYFKVTKQQKLMVEVTGGGTERCLLYPMSDVDLYGFSGPVCNEEYEFPVGTYYVGVTRRDERDGRESFTIRVK